ncbi:hypothetical protein HQ563_07455 [bacterium]|nr:hypothetical protein [bacterium]
MTRPLVPEDCELLNDKRSLLTSENRVPAFVTAGILLTAAHILDYQLATGVFATILDLNPVTYPG